MLNRDVSLCVLLSALFAFQPVANAMSKRQLLAKDPGARNAVATDELSPFTPMYLTSYLGAAGALLYFAPTKDSPDYNRNQVKEMAGVAGSAVLLGGSAAYLLSVVLSPSITTEERDKLGDLAAADVDTNQLKIRRRLFYFFHAINSVAIGAVASQSIRSDRWSAFALQAALPFAVDLSARHLFGSKAVSPWTLSFFPVYERGHSIPPIALVCSW